MYPSGMDIEKIGAAIVDTDTAFIKKLGPGLLEHAYQKVMVRELVRRGLFVEAQKSVSFEYEGLWIPDAFVADIVVERSIVIELKSVVEIKPVHLMQVLTYMRLLDYRLGFLINFKTSLFRNGVKRVVL